MLVKSLEKVQRSTEGWFSNHSTGGRGKGRRPPISGWVAMSPHTLQAVEKQECSELE